MSLPVATPVPPLETPPTANFAYRTVTAAAIVLAMVLLVVIFTVAASAFFLIFGSLLLAAIFCGLGRLLQRTGLPRWAAMLTVFLVTLALIIVPVLWGGLAVVQQFSQLLSGVRDQANTLLASLADLGLPVSPDTTANDLESMLPNPSGLVSSAGKAVFSALGGLGNFFVLLFLAIFIAWQPGLYRDGLVSLFPKEKRARIADVLEQSAHSLIMWVAGDAISMAMIFSISWVGLWAIGINNAFLLALQAGLLAFIPTLGPFVAGVVIVLAGLAQGVDMALWALGVYVLIQGVESNVAQPMAQRFTSALPPALTLSVQIIFGLLFGLLGFVLAVPFVAVLVTMVRELYVVDVLGGPVETVE
ncbi:AI-2E family transporter [Aureimonas sp. AU12]|uniref:AI-2E family transporter n=1 Tax=Aureimonas sp. AU12 TaxID=1638161 RepID=UPI00078272C6|nr:AI-2E family transporter [Aureimonas sp. AU12]